jgi:hypothetical protein
MRAKQGQSVYSDCVECHGEALEQLDNGLIEKREAQGFVANLARRFWCPELQKEVRVGICKARIAQQKCQSEACVFFSKKETRIIKVNFTDYPDLFNQLKEQAREDMRTIQQQIIWCCKRELME